jgi:hypothetical protein
VFDWLGWQKGARRMEVHRQLPPIDWWQLPSRLLVTGVEVMLATVVYS